MSSTGTPARPQTGDPAPPASSASPLWWAGAGLVAGLAGLATSYLVSQALHQRLTPIGAVAELVIRLAPGDAARGAEQSVGANDKPILGATIKVVLVLVFLALGWAARRRSWAPYAGFGVLFVVGVVAVLTSPGVTGANLVPLVIGLVTWFFAISALGEKLRTAARYDDVEAGAATAAAGRRGFLLLGGAIAGGSVLITVLGRYADGAHRAAELARARLKLPITQPKVPAGVSVGVEGTSSWMTSVADFYRIDTAYVPPSIQPTDWSLRIHGMVDRELTLSYDDLVARQLTEDWITLNCVSNPVGGPYIGNAWWSGIRLDALLKEVGVSDDANAVLQTSQDGWTCGTPLSALTDGRNAMLAVAMNGQPLPIEHGFPVRTVVPGLYGYVSACKWVVDMEVTTFDDFSAFWTQRGWGEMGPVKLSSRVEVPRANAAVNVGQATFAGTAWAQDVGVAKVEISVDGGAWVTATLGAAPDDDSWVQWKAVTAVAAGAHQVRVRATDKAGLVQTGARQGVLPDGATGWDTVSFRA